MAKKVARQPFLVRFSIYLSAGLLQQLVTFALLPFFSFFLTAGEIGLVGVLLAVESLLALVFDFGTRASAVRYYHAHNAGARDITIARLFILSAAISAVLSPLSFLLVTQTWDLWTLLPEPSATVIAMLVATAFLQRINLFAQQMYRTREQARAFAVVAVSRTVALLVLSLLFVGVFHWGVLGIFVARALSSFLTSLPELKSLCWPALRPRDGVAVEPVLPVWLFAVPLFGLQLSNWGRGVFDRIVLSNLVDAPSVGVYFTASLAGAAIILLTGTFDQTFAPWYYRKRTADDAGIRDLSAHISRLYLGLLGLVCLTAMALAPEIYHTVFKRDLSMAGIVAPALILGQFIGAAAEFFTKVLVFHRKVKILPLLSVSSVVLGFLAMIPSIGAFGLIGGAAGLIVANLVMLFGTWAAVSRIERPDFNLAVTLAMSAVLAVFAVVVYREGVAFDPASMGVRLAVALACGGALIFLVGRKARQLLMGMVKKRRIEPQ